MDIRDIRKELRDELVGEVVWYYANATEPLLHDGGLLNISDSGLNIIINVAVDEGKVLIVQIKGKDKTARPAEVRWCKEISPMIFRVGLLYD